MNKLLDLAALGARNISCPSRQFAQLGEREHARVQKGLGLVLRLNSYLWLEIRGGSERRADADHG